MNQTFCWKGKHPWTEENTRTYTRKDGSTYKVCYLCKLMSAKKRMSKVKERIMTHYGGCCSCCGETILDFLAIDHIENNGAEHRRSEGYETGWQTYYWIIRNGYPEGFQVLCHNCNWAKHIHGQCPYHQKECIFYEEEE